MHAWGLGLSACMVRSACGFISGGAAIRVKRIITDSHLAWLGNLAVRVANERRDDTVEQSVGNWDEEKCIQTHI